MMSWLGRIRPQIAMLILGLATIAIISIHYGYSEIAMACIVGMVAFGNKLIEEEGLGE